MRTVPNANMAGRGGEVAALARQAAVDAFARLRAVLDSPSPLAAGPAAEAAGLLLNDRSKDGRAGRKLAVSRLRDLVNDPKTPDAAAIRAASLLIQATGRPSAYAGPDRPHRRAAR